MTTTQSLPIPNTDDGHLLQLAVAGYLARFKGLSRTHAESDLRSYLGWCAGTTQRLLIARPCRTAREPRPCRRAR